eukprot:6310861-Alexandrium_andersonii.AAC.1
MARALGCAMAPWAFSDAALACVVESCVRVACDSAALADAEELVLRLPQKPAAAPAAKKGRSWETVALASVLKQGWKLGDGRA